MGQLLGIRHDVDRMDPPIPRLDGKHRLWTPAGAALAVSVMLVAAVSVHWKNGFSIGKGGVEYTVVLALAAAALAFTGPGAFSADEALGRSWSSAVAAAALAIGIAGGALQLLTRRPAAVEAVQAQPS